MRHADAQVELRRAAIDDIDALLRLQQDNYRRSGFVELGRVLMAKKLHRPFWSRSSISSIAVKRPQRLTDYGPLCATQILPIQNADDVRYSRMRRLVLFGSITMLVTGCVAPFPPLPGYDVAGNGPSQGYYYDAPYYGDGSYYVERQNYGRYYGNRPYDSGGRSYYRRNDYPGRYYRANDPYHDKGERHKYRRDNDDRDRHKSDRDRDKGDKDRDKGDKDRGRGDKDRDKGDRDRDKGDRDRDKGDKDRGRGDKDRDKGGEKHKKHHDND